MPRLGASPGGRDDGSMRSVEGIEEQHREWLDAVGAVAGVQLDLRTVERVLDLAKDVAHDAARPLAPVAAYALGIAVAGGADPDETARRIAGQGVSD